MASLEAGPLELGNKHTEGHPGFTIANEPGSGYGNLTDSISGYLNPRLFPDIILLMIGTNDINRQFEVDQAPAKLDHLISLISDRSTGLRPNAKLIVSNILPIDDIHNQFAWPGADSNRNRDVDIFNATIPGIVAAHRGRGENVGFTDIHSLFTFADIADGLHPTPAGFDKLGDAWSSAILAIPEPTSCLLIVLGSLGMWPMYRVCKSISGRSSCSHCRSYYGDFNRNGVVDAADYTIWRDTLGGIVTPYSGADGSGNGVIDQADRDVWVAHFGQLLFGSGAGNAARSSVNDSATGEEPPGISADRSASPFSHGTQAVAQTQLNRSRGDRAPKSSERISANTPRRFSLPTPRAHGQVGRSQLSSNRPLAAVRRDEALLTWLGLQTGGQPRRSDFEHKKVRDYRAIDELGESGFDAVDEVFGALSVGA